MSKKIILIVVAPLLWIISFPTFAGFNYHIQVINNANENSINLIKGKQQHCTKKVRLETKTSDTNKTYLWKTKGSIKCVLSSNISYFDYKIQMTVDGKEVVVASGRCKGNHSSGPSGHHISCSANAKAGYSVTPKKNDDKSYQLTIR